MNTNVPLDSLPTGVLIGIGVLVIVQVVVEIYALIQLFKTPDDRIAFGKKWLWVIIILFVNLVGAVIFLVAGRKPAPAAEPLQPSRPSTDRAERAADVLYGDKGGDQA
ncbi:MAG: PLD nuclease N-terminal domain-containing protein [Coriobacteriia bacterium]